VELGKNIFTNVVLFLEKKNKKMLKKWTGKTD